MNHRIGKTLATWLMVAATLFPWHSYGDTQQPLSQEALQQLVAPIALYPDPLLAQILMASTYPLEVVSADRWIKANSKLSGKTLEDALQQQTWDPSVKSLTAVPDVLDMMNTKLDMTEQLGDAFLAQQKDVMDAIQALRAKAKTTGNLKSNDQQYVSSNQTPAPNNDSTSASSDNQSVSSEYITILPTNPEMIYVPTYDPNIVYGAWPYPAYPPYYYYPSGFNAGMALSFASGIFVGSALWGHCDWAGHNVNINVNEYNRYNRTNISNNDWHHDPAHRGNVPYNNHALQQKYGKDQLQNAKARDDFRGRAEQGRQEMARDGHNALEQMDRDGQRREQQTQNQNNMNQQRQDHQDRINQQSRDNRAQQQRNRPQQDFHPENFHDNHRPNAFEGINHGEDMHRFSDRGAASRSGGGGGGFHGGGRRR